MAQRPRRRTVRRPKTVTVRAHRRRTKHGIVYVPRHRRSTPR